MKEIPDKFYDLAVCDPPFGLGDKLTSGGTWASKYTSEDAKWDVLPTQEYWKELFRVSKNQIVWGGNYFGLPPTRCFIIWDKVAHMETLSDCEYAWTSFDRNAKIFKLVRNGTEKRIHRTQKPIKLYRWILDKYANSGDKILDTHLGSGSSAIAAHEFDFFFHGCEIDQKKFELSVERIKTRTAQQKFSFPQ